MYKLILLFALALALASCLEAIEPFTKPFSPMPGPGGKVPVTAICQRCGSI